MINGNVTTFESVSGYAFSRLIKHTVFVPKSTTLESSLDLIPEVKSEGGWQKGEW